MLFLEFLSGALLCNAVPHLASGLRGEIFPTPFSSPHGRGPSSPLVNFLWGMLNLSTGGWLLARHPVTIGLHADCVAAVAGALTIGCFLSLHFGKGRRERAWG